MSWCLRSISLLKIETRRVLYSKSRDAGHWTTGFPIFLPFLEAKSRGLHCFFFRGTRETRLDVDLLAIVRESTAFVPPIGGCPFSSPSKRPNRGGGVLYFLRLGESRWHRSPLRRKRVVPLSRHALSSARFKEGTLAALSGPSGTLLGEDLRHCFSRASTDNDRCGLDFFVPHVLRSTAMRVLVSVFAGTKQHGAPFFVHVSAKVNNLRGPFFP